MEDPLAWALISKNVPSFKYFGLMMNGFEKKRNKESIIPPKTREAQFKIVFVC